MLIKDFKAVLLDVDGVLYDSMPLHVKAWQKAFVTIGFKCPAKWVYLQEGRTNEEVVKSAVREFRLPPLSAREIKKLSKIKAKTYNSLPNPEFIPGSRNLIKAIRKANLKLCLVTGSSQSKTLKRIEKDFKVKRKEIITGDDVDKGKPHPEPYTAGARKLRVLPRNCLVIENAPLGIKSAVKAKMTAIGLKTGPLPRQLLLKAGAKAVYKDCRELLKHLTFA